MGGVKSRPHRGTTSTSGSTAPPKKSLARTKPAQKSRTRAGDSLDSHDDDSDGDTVPATSGNKVIESTSIPVLDDRTRAAMLMESAREASSTGSKSSALRRASRRPSLASGGSMSRVPVVAGQFVEEKPPTWANAGSRAKFKEDLSLMRQFYVWDEIPLEFFVDEQVEQASALQHRLSVAASLLTRRGSIAPPPEASKPAPKVATRPEPVEASRPKARPEPQATKPPPPRPPRPADPVALARLEEGRGRSASVGVSNPGTRVVVVPPGGKSKASEKQQQPPVDFLSYRKERQQQQQQQQSQPASRAPMLEELAEASPGTRARHLSISAGQLHQVPVVPTRDQRSNGSIVSQLQDEDARPRRSSVTTVDAVYGRVGPEDAAFEVSNPLLMSDFKAASFRSEGGRRARAATITASTAQAQYIRAYKPVAIDMTDRRRTSVVRGGGGSHHRPTVAVPAGKYMVDVLAPHPDVY